MANDIAQRAVWSISSASQGNKRIRRMKDYSGKDNSSRDGVPEVGSAKCVAFMKKPGARIITFNIRETKGAKPEVDYQYLNDTDEVFALTKNIVGGRRRQYPECMISSISDSGDDQGELAYSVDIVVLEELPL